jgi:hypothetical protein
VIGGISASMSTSTATRLAVATARTSWAASSSTGVSRISSGSTGRCLEKAGVFIESPMMRVVEACVAGCPSRPWPGAGRPS